MWTTFVKKMPTCQLAAMTAVSMHTCQAEADRLAVDEADSRFEGTRGIGRATTAPNAGCKRWLNVESERYNLA